MKFSKLTILLLSVVASVVYAGEEDDHGDDHGHGDEHHSCACEADELGLTLDCSDKVNMNNAVAYLKSASCATAGNCAEDAPNECYANWVIVQSHHDGCAEDLVTQEVEDEFHNFEEACEKCEIDKPYDEALPDCPDVDCESGDGNAAYLRLITNGCLTTCNEAVCKDDYFTLVATHDNCASDDLSDTAEKGLHDLETSCAAFTCNTGKKGSDPFECVEEDHDDHDDSGAPVAAFGAVLAAGAAVLAI